MSNLKTLVLMSLVAGLTAPVLANEKPVIKPLVLNPGVLTNVNCSVAEPLTSGTFTIPAGGYQYFTYVGTGAGLNLSTCGSGVDADFFILDNCVDQNVLEYTDAGLTNQCSWDAVITCDFYFFEDGVEYLIAFADYYGGGGSLVINMGEPCGEPVDPCEGIECVANLTLPVYQTGTNVGAPNFLTNFPGGAAGDVLYCLTVEEECVSDIILCGSNYDTKVMVYNTFPCPQPLSQLGYNDDFCGLQSTIEDFTFLPGTYYIVVTGYSASEGNFVLDIPGCPVVDANELPTAYSLKQNVPNPFNPTTTINFSMGETGAASLKVFDLSGREVAALVNGNVERGEHSVSFDASNLSSGVYFYTLQAGATIETKKMVLMK